MKVLGRGMSDFIEVPDSPVPPSPATTVFRGETTADTHVTSDHAAADILRADPIIPTAAMPEAALASVSFSSFAHTDAPIQWFAQNDAAIQWFAQASAPLVPVLSAVTDLQGMSVGRSDGGDLGGSGGGGSGEIGRGLDGLPQMAMNLSDYSDHGWSIVPSAANEYGASYTVAAGDDFVWNGATGEFASDFFIV